MRLFFIAFVVYVSSSALALGLSLTDINLRLPEFPEHEPHAFYYLQIMTAHEHGRVVTTEDGAALKIRLAIKIFAGEEEAVIIVRDTNDYSNCERLTGIKVVHYNSPSGHNVIIKGSIRNAEGQEFSFRWRHKPNKDSHYLQRFVIYLPESTRGHPLNFIAVPAENPQKRPDMPQAKIAADYFSGTNPDCN